MSETLLLRLPGAADQPVEWLLVDAHGSAVGTPQTGALAEAALSAAGRRCCVVVPAGDVLLADAELPARSGARLSQVAGFALEDQLVGDVEDLHFAIGRRNDRTGRTPVAVVNRALLADWLHRLAEVGIVPSSVHGENSLLPLNPAQAVALLEHGQLLFAPPEDQGMPIALAADDLFAALALALRQSPGTQHLLFHVSAGEWREQQGRLEQLREQFAGINLQVLNGGSLPWLALQLDRASAINLLQGEFARRSSLAGEWQRWRLAATLAALALLVYAGSASYQRFRLGQGEAQLDRQLGEISTRYFGGSVSAGGLRAAVEQRLLGAGADSGRFLPALEALATASNGSGATLESLSYSDQTLTMRLLAPSSESVEQLKQKLQQSGWPAELVSGGAHGEQFEGQLEVRLRAT